MRPSGTQPVLGYSAAVLGGCVTRHTVHDGDLHPLRDREPDPVRKPPLMFECASLDHS